MTHILIPRTPSMNLLRPFIECPTSELDQAWAAMVRIAEVQHARAGSQCLAQIEVPAQPRPWDAADIKQPHWGHVFAAFVEGAKEARANPEADEYIFGRSADAHTKRVLEEIDPVSEAALRTASWVAEQPAAAPGSAAPAAVAPQGEYPQLPKPAGRIEVRTVTWATSTHC